MLGLGACVIVGASNPGTLEIGPNSGVAIGAEAFEPGITHRGATPTAEDNLPYEQSGNIMILWRAGSPGGRAGTVPISVLRCDCISYR